jgi:acyl-CoA reductase-like NAD-dependent aldehyde dehydrogenase
VRREPWGIVAVLGTWNYAFFISLSQILFAAAAGNAVIFKGAPESPKVTRLVEELLEEAGFPRDLVFCASGPAEAGEALTLAACDKYILTGSRSTGRKVLEAAAQALKPAVVELSGADAFVILGDADWKLAVKTLLWAAFQYSGQTCVAPRRVFILEKDREKILALFGRTASDLGEFIHAQGKLRTAERAREERAKIDRAVKRGAKLLWQAEGGAEGGSAFAPRVYRGLPADEDADFMAPVFFLQEFGTENEILGALDAGHFGLGASVWTADRQKGRIFANAIRAGQVWVNDAIFSVALGEAPFGGARQSGFGRTRGEEGLLEMTQAKFVSFDWRARRSTRYLPPYRSDSFAILDELQKILFHPDWKMKWRGLSVILRTASGGPKDLRDSSAPRAPQNDVK